MPRRFATVAVAGLVVSLSVSGCATILAARKSPEATSPGPTVSSTVPDPSPSPTPDNETAAPSAADPNASAAPPAAEPSPTQRSAAPAATTGLSPDMADWTLTTAGWGPVRLGSELPGNLRGQLKPSWECVGPIIKDRQGNERMEFFTGRADGSGRINTLHIVSPGVTTRSGIRSGDSLAELKRTYPKLQLFSAKGGAGSPAGDVYLLRDDDKGLFFEMQPNTLTVEHISVQQTDRFYPFQLQVCGAP